MMRLLLPVLLLFFQSSRSFILPAPDLRQHPQQQWKACHRLIVVVPRATLDANADDLTKKSLRLALGIGQTTTTSPTSSLLRHRPKVIGHRGALYEELENTRASFLRCVEWGCDAVELDVFCIRDGTLVVFHGGGTDEHPGDLSEHCLHQTGVSILDLTYEECLQLQFNPDYAEFPCPPEKIQQATIPTLEQVLLDLKDTKTQVKIELKMFDTTEPVLKLVEQLEMVQQCQFSSFDHQALQWLRQLRPQTDPNGNHVYRTGALFNVPVPDSFVEQALAIQANEVHLRYDMCTIDRIQAIHTAGLQSMAWLRGPIGMASDVKDKYWDVGNEDETCYKVLIDTNVQQICCNRPNVLIDLLKRWPVPQ